MKTRTLVRFGWCCAGGRPACVRGEAGHGGWPGTSRPRRQALADLRRPGRRLNLYACSRFCCCRSPVAFLVTEGSRGVGRADPPRPVSGNNCSARTAARSYSSAGRPSRPAPLAVAGGVIRSRLWNVPGGRLDESATTCSPWSAGSPRSQPHEPAVIAAGNDCWGSPRRQDVGTDSRHTALLVAGCARCCAVP